MSAAVRARTFAAGILAAAALGACASAPAGAPTSPPPGATSPAAGATAGAPTAGAATSVPATAVVTKAPAKLPTVDLVMSGVTAITLHGTAGTCTIGSVGGTPAIFGFQAVESDYAGLGVGLYISEGNGGYVLIKWAVDSNTGYINRKDITGVVSADHLSITLDHDIEGSPGVEHLKGTITCP